MKNSTLHRSPFPLHRHILILLLITLVTGCSALRLGYRHADTYLAWRVDEYFDLDQRQKQDFNARLERLLAWHRYEQLPEYVLFLNTALKRAQYELKQEDILWFVDGIRSRYRLVVDRGIGDASEMLAGITPEQIGELQKQWTKDNRKFVREHELEGTLAERKRARLKRSLTQIRDWTGNLSDEQEQKIESLMETIPHSNHLRYQDRLRRQKEFVELLKLRANRGEFQPRLHAWLRNWETGRTPDYAQLSNEVFGKRMQFYMAVEKLLTPAQRQTAWRRLQDFADDFDALSKKPVKAAAYPDGVAMLALFCLPASNACLSE